MKSLTTCLLSMLVLLAASLPVGASGGAPAAAPQSRIAELLDTNQDDKISSEEWQAAPNVLTTESFELLDNDPKDSELAGSELIQLGSGGTRNPTDLFLCIAYAAVALLFSSLCSVAEAVLLSVSPSYVANLEKEGTKSAARIKSVKQNVDRSLAAILTLNTIAHTIGSGGAGAYAAKYFGDQWVGVAMINSRPNGPVDRELWSISDQRVAD